MKKLIFIISLIAVVFSACDNPKGKRLTKNLLIPSSSGNPYEVMIVADDSIYDGYVGAALKDVLSVPMEGLPQREKTFHISHITEKHYDRITNLFRNIILIHIGKQFTQPKFHIERDVFSQPQTILTIQSPDITQASVYITEKKNYIIQLFANDEINRMAQYLTEIYNKEFYDSVKSRFGCEFYIPVDINKMKLGKDFIWASNDALSGIQNIVIYSYPYVSKDVFNRGAYIALRDSFMKANIPGGKPNQYMATDKSTVITRNISSQGYYAYEARGLWQMENDAMGGPFVSHSVVDTLNNRIIVVEGFVYAPEKMKRTMVRNLEAALYTLSVPSAEALDEENKEKE